MASSYGIVVEYKWEAQAAVEHLASGAMLLDSYINSALVTASWKVKDELASRAPEGVGATYGQGLRNNIERSVDSRAKTATIGPNKRSVPYAAAVEYGSRPHMPPTDPNGSLAQWCELKGLKLWPIAMKIFHYGTKPHPYVQPTWQAMKAPVSQVFADAIAQYAEAM